MVVVDAVILRYVHFVCMAVLFDIRVQCDHYLHSNATGDWLQQLRTTACASNCMHDDGERTLESCVKQCAEMRLLDVAQRPPPDVRPPLPIEPPLELRVRQLCRDDRSMWLQLVDAATGHELRTNRWADGRRTLVIYRLQETDNMLALNIVYIVGARFNSFALLLLKPPLN